MIQRISACLMALCTTAHASDWPQILGPNRDGNAIAEKINATFDKQGPPVLWQHKVGSGYAGPAVSGKTVVIFHRVENSEICEALDIATGKPRWSQKFPTTFRSGFSSDHGPRCVPAIAGENVVLGSAGGVLRCLNFKSGKPKWAVDLRKTYRSPEGYFGFGSSPIIWKDRVIIETGSRNKTAALAAFSLKTGKELWTSLADTASYSSPILIKVGKVDVLVAVTRLNCVGVDPKTGKVRFRMPFGKRGTTVNGANPVMVSKDEIFLTASYGIGATLAKINGEGIKAVWNSDELISSQYSTPLVRKGFVFGVHGRDDGGQPELRCLDPVTKKVRWSTESDYAVLIGVGNTALGLTTSGELFTFSLDDRKHRELSRAKVFRTTTRALPALAAGRLYARDEGVLKCFDLRAKK